MRVQEITDKGIWEQFVQNIAPHTFLQAWNWGEAQQELGGEIARFGVYDGEKLIAAALTLIVRARRGSFLFCPHGPVFGGGDIPTSLKVLTEKLTEYARSKGCSFIRVSSLLSDTPDNRALFKGLGFRDAPVHMMHPERAWMLDVSQSKEVLMKGMRKTTRYCVRKAPKDGIEITMSDNPDDIERFWDVYKETASRHKFVPFSRTYIDTEFRTFIQDDQVRYFFAHHDGEVIAASMIIFYGNSAFYHHGASTHTHKNLSTTSYLLQWRAIQEAKKRRLKLYNFWGIVDPKDGRHPWAGITLFKRGFGGFEERYVHAKDYILSKKYWITYIIELTRKLKRGY